MGTGPSGTCQVTPPSSLWGLPWALIPDFLFVCSLLSSQRSSSHYSSLFLLVSRPRFVISAHPPLPFNFWFSREWYRDLVPQRSAAGACSAVLFLGSCSRSDLPREPILRRSSAGTCPVVYFYRYLSRGVLPWDRFEMVLFLKTPFCLQKQPQNRKKQPLF